MPGHPASPPRPVRLPVLRQRWESVSFLHWPYPPAALAGHLPPGVELELHEGRAWVSLVLFRMHVHPPFGPAVDLLPPFPQSNVRTYVVGPGGRPGIWVLSLDATNAAVAAAARALYALPYETAQMSVDETGDRVRYRSSRRGGPGHDLEVVPGVAITPTERDLYLTARFTLWNRNRGLLLRTQVEHPPWELRAATVRGDQDLLPAAGLPAPDGEPLAHSGGTVEVRLSAPRPYRA